jgi:hypothetical protein
MASSIGAGVGKAALLKAIDWSYAPKAGLMGSHLEWLKTPPKRHSPRTMAETLEMIRALKASHPASAPSGLRQYYPTTRCPVRTSIAWLQATLSPVPPWN